MSSPSLMKGDTGDLSNKWHAGKPGPRTLEKSENRDPSGTLEKPENQDPSGTLAGPQKNPKNQDPGP